MSILYQMYEEKFQKQVIKLILEIQRNEFDINVSLDKQYDLKEIPSFYQRDKGNFWIAIDKKTVVGTIALLDIANNEVALRKLFVHKDYRGRGVAKNLLDILIQWSREKNVKSIYLGTTPAFLAAHRFYEKNGFGEIQKEDLPKNFPIMEVDKKFYKFTI